MKTQEYINTAKRISLKKLAQLLSEDFPALDITIAGMSIKELSGPLSPSQKADGLWIESFFRKNPKQFSGGTKSFAQAALNACIKNV